jgi:hypothetical protein
LFPLFATGDPGSKFTTSTVGTSGKFGTGINDNSGTGGKFTTRVVDTGDKFANISKNFRKNLKLPLCCFLGVWGKMINEKI